MKYGICFNRYDKEIYIYKIFNDGSRVKILELFEYGDNIDLIVEASDFKYIIEFNEQTKLFEMDMVGVNLNILYSNLVEIGLIEIEE